jgi:hypothetical protein
MILSEVLLKLAETIPVSFEEMKEGQLMVDNGSEDLIAELKSDASRSAQMAKPPIRMNKNTPNMIRMRLVIRCIVFFMPVSITII